MGVLLDTCTLVWLTTNLKMIPAGTKDTIIDSEHVFVSVLSFVEIAIKERKAAIVPDTASAFMRKVLGIPNIEPLGFDTESAHIFAHLPWHHKDPFDRMLISQALAHELTIITPDAHISQYEVATEW